MKKKLPLLTARRLSLSVNNAFCQQCKRWFLSSLIFYFLEVFSISKELMINEEIRDGEVRVIDSDGSQLGIMSGADALDKAAAKILILLKISPQANPPLCKIMDIGKYRFELAKGKRKTARIKKS